jgi:hypothetical protein
MGTVLMFQARPQMAGGHETAGPAEILLFTGVRYERMVDETPAPENPTEAHEAPRARSRRRS